MNKKFFSGNRFRLVDGLIDEKCMIVLSSGYEISRSADENYEFQVNNNFFYLTGIKQPNVHLILLKDKKEYTELLYIDEYNEMYEKWLGHRLNKKEASTQSGIYNSNIQYINEFEKDFENYLNQYSIVYLDLETNNNLHHHSFGLSLASTLASEYPKNEIKNIYNTIIKLRLSKQPCEIKALKKAISITKLGIENLMKNAKPNQYEYQLEAYYDFVLKQNGNKEHSFKTIAASGKNATILHYSANDSFIHENDLILFDLGCKENGYCSDITRTFPINGQFNLLQKKIYNIVLKANKEIIKQAHAGMTLKELQDICMDVLAKGCLKAKLIKNKDEISKYYYHGVSHSIGLDTHDPYLREMPLPINAIISNEPGLYFPEYKIGIRIEDDLLLKENHAVNLSKSIIKSIKQIEKYMNKKENMEERK